MTRTLRWFFLFGILLLLVSQPCYCEDEDDEDDDDEDHDEAMEDEFDEDRPIDEMDEYEEDGEFWLPMWKELGCKAIFAAGPRPIHSMSDWMRMRQAYIDVMTTNQKQKKWITIPNPVVSKTGFAISYEARQAGTKGRGVFVTETPVKKGQKIWSTYQTARFDSGIDYRRFLYAIPKDFACDVLQWAYVQSVKNSSEQTEKPYISADLDEGSLINSYEDWNEEGTVHTPNVGCDEEQARNDRGGCQENYYALRDIPVGEELLLDYQDFAITDGWEWFGPWDTPLEEQEL